MSLIHWRPGEPILTLSSKRSLRGVIRRIRGTKPWWLVIRREVDWQPDPYLYAFLAEELLEFAEVHQDLLDRPVEEVLDLRESGRSAVTLSWEVEEVVEGWSHSPSSFRAVHVDAEGRPSVVGEVEMAVGAPPPEMAGEPDPGELEEASPPGDEGAPSDEGEEEAAFEDAAPEEAGAEWEGSEGLGPTRSSGRASPAPPRERAELEERFERMEPRERLEMGPERKLQVFISAQMQEELEVGSVDLVDFRIELFGEARPLRHALDGPVEVEADRTIRVLLSTFGDAIQAAGERIQQVDPPRSGRPTVGAFEIQALEPGSAEIALHFRQGGTQLGAVHFSVSVVPEARHQKPAQARITAEPRDRDDDEVLVLLIEQRKEGGAIHYEYRLHSEALGFNYLPLSSAPLRDRGGGAAATTQAYVEWIYDRVGEEVRNWGQARRLARGLRTVGMDMCEQLFDPDVTRRLWDNRDKLKMIQVTSWEPYIPWEILRLRDPDTGDPDDRFLGEYGLIRALPGEAQPRSLRMRDWSYLAAEYPYGTEAAVGAEVSYLTETLPQRGIQPTRIAPAYDPFFDAMEAGDFDVLHLACHGESAHDRIDHSLLVISDEVGPDGQARPVAVDEKAVRYDARLGNRRPLVFLNACASGRHGPSLTAWGGWPKAFLKAGAGAFVGTSWPVRDKPAARFAETFYDALQEGRTLAQAATAAREATKGMGDGSWLAYKVYGHPRARVDG